MLKALELAGFKSFADKTRLEFHAGVTCVVGPNGSGKSNVVDAIKWVLGSQSPKSLRGSEMTDVIFNGSAGRKPLNAAEVTLEFDNSTGHIELKEPLVRITRRVLRSGEGEYAINGAACRLRDLKTLLAGTGIGVESYNIIEQGRVDAVLNASAKDRRALFEEAAGVSRFRLKKQEAMRRLARVEQNLLRLSDIVDEVEGRLRRVRMQAGKARRYREQSNRLKELRTDLGLADWRVLTARLEELDRVGDELSGQHEQLAGGVAEGERRLEALESGEDSAGEELTAIDAELATLRERLASRQSGVASDTVRLEELEDALTHAGRRLVATRIDDATRAGGASVAELRKKHAAERERLAEATSAANRAAAEADSQANRLESLHEQRRALKQRSKTIDQTLAEATREADRLAVRLEVSRQQLAEHDPLLERVQSQHADATAQAEACGAELQTLRRRTTQVELAASEAKRRRSDLREALAAARQQVARQEAEVEGERRQLAALEAADMQLDRLREEMARLLGPRPDSRETLSAAPGDVATIRGLVADVMHVDFDTAPIIEAALGERAHHLVVDDGEALLAALDGQTEPLATRAYFQRLDARSAGAAVDRIDLSGLPGVMGRADRFVEAEAEFSPLVTRLLGRTWIVDRLETAARLAKGEGQGLNFVTFDGETIAADGSIVAGPQAESAGVLTRRRQIAMLTESLEAAGGRLAELVEAVTQANRRLAAASDDADRLTAEHATLAARLSELGQRAAALGERRERLDEELRRISTEREKLLQQNAATEESIRSGRDRRQQRRAELEAADRERLALDKQIEASERELASASATANEARVVIAGHEQHAEILAGQLAQLERDASERATGDAEAAAEVVACRSKVEACRLSLLAGRAEIAEATIAAERLARRRRGLAESKRGEVERRQQLARALHEARRQLESVRARLNQSQLESERLRLERTALAERMRDDYGVDLAEAARSAPPVAETAPPEERATLEQELAQLRRQVSDVGAVNLDSLEELDELEERFAELSSQYKDLSEAKASLERLATRISTESRQLFLATVEEVRGHFRELFRRLFGGGEADILILEEGEGGDPLEAGVEIAASPPGKELRSISLLSGGEKTMTCVALLLAVFRTKPSPFCILDEVDAALDEANIGRFTGVLSEFLSSTQFVVVTHSKKTMTGADTLYGVTMQESGVSKQVAVRFEDVGEDGQINPAATLRRAAPERRAA